MEVMASIIYVVDKDGDTHHKTEQVRPLAGSGKAVPTSFLDPGSNSAGFEGVSTETTPSLDHHSKHSHCAAVFHCEGETEEFQINGFVY